MADGPVRWGILGTGGIAGTFATDLRLTGSGVVSAVGSRARGSADRFADTFGIPRRHGSYEALAADPDVDVVYVATPHPMHRDNAILALRAGKPVLVEKPFTMTAAEAREVAGVARQHGLFAMEAMWTRFLPHTAVIRDWLARGVLGDVGRVGGVRLHGGRLDAARVLRVVRGHGAGGHRLGGPAPARAAGAVARVGLAAAR